MEELLKKYNQPKSKTKRPPRNEREEVVEVARQINGASYIQTLQLTKHLQEDVIHLINRESNGVAQFWWNKFNLKYKTNNMFDEVKEKLEKFPAFRERALRADYLAKLALRSIKLEETYRNRPLNLAELAKFAIKFATYERAWRDVTMRFSELQGKDYNNKELLEKQKQNDLGYLTK